MKKKKYNKKYYTGGRVDMSKGGRVKAQTGGLKKAPTEKKDEPMSIEKKPTKNVKPVTEQKPLQPTEKLL